MSLLHLETAVKWYESTELFRTSREDNLDLLQAAILDIYLSTFEPLTAEPVVTAINERNIFLGSRLKQLVNMVGTEEIYFCLLRPAWLDEQLEKITGVDIYDVIHRNNDTAFAELKRKLESSRSWIKRGMPRA